METTHNVRLTSSEFGNLWSSYMNDSMAIQVSRYYIEKVEDTEIRSVLEFVLGLASKHLQQAADILNQARHPLPHGFTDKDVNITAPRLFSDSLFLIYVEMAARMGISAFSMAFMTSTRRDVRDFYGQCLMDDKEILNKVVDVMLSKGIYVRPPYISIPEKVEFVQKQNFMDGLFGDKRPLLAQEITQLFTNIQTNVLGKALVTGFSQVARSKQVREYMVRGKMIAAKHIEVFGSILSEADLPSPIIRDTEVMESTIPPFSDKFMMFHTTMLSAYGMGGYGTSLSVSMRSDLPANYARLMAEIGEYAKDGATIMIDNGWMEQPPQADDRRALSKV